MSVLHDHSQGADPGDLLSQGILYEEGIHLKKIVGNEVEGEVLFPMNREAQQLARGEHDTVVRVTTHSGWALSRGHLCNNHYKRKDIQVS